MIWKTIPNPDSINRQKRFTKEVNPELKTYDKEVLFYQTAIYQALIEMAMEDKDDE